MESTLFNVEQRPPSIELVVYQNLEAVLAKLRAAGVKFAKFGTVELTLSDRQPDPVKSGEPESVKTPLDHLFPRGKPEFV